MVADRRNKSHYPLVTDNVWGLDLNGTLQGAGGVGGLLAVVRDDGVFLPTYDANGNISEYVSTNGDIVAHYDYSPFGETLMQTGDMAASFTHRFSTKPWCPVTGLCEYQMRKYRPELGRWLSRDPIGEEELNCNLYFFCKNSSLEECDLYGAMPIEWGTPITYPSEPPYEFIFPEIKACSRDEKTAIAVNENRIGIFHLLERLKMLRGTESLFNYFEFNLECERNETAFDAQITQVSTGLGSDKILFQTAKPAWVPGYPKYELGGGVAKVSVQTRIWLKYPLQKLLQIDAFTRLRVTVVVCYKCKCTETDKSE